MGKKSYSAPLARLKKDAHKQEGEYGKGETFLMNTGRIQGWEKAPFRFVGVLLESENKLQVKSRLMVL